MQKVSSNIENVWGKLESRLRVFINSRVKNESVADDILQETFIRIHENIDSLRDKTKFQSWIYQIARNLIIDHFRGNKKLDTCVTNVLPEIVENDAENEDLMSETLADMLKMMDNLPPKYCEALCLTELGGMSQIEYSKHIGLSYSAAKSRIQRSRVMLRDMLMNCCHYHFDKYGTVIDIHPVRCCCCQHGQI